MKRITLCLMFLIMLSNILQSKNYLVEVDDEKDSINASVDQEEVDNEDIEELNDGIESEGTFITLYRI